MSPQQIKVYRYVMGFYDDILAVRRRPGPVGRVDFGTDSSVFPRGWRNDLFREQLDILNSIGLNQDDQHNVFAGDDQHNVFAGNVKRILKLKRLCIE